MRSEILQKSLEQFLKYGIREMSNQKLVELLGISTKTIYKYFKNKEELLEEVMYLHHALQQEMMISIPAGESAVCYFYDLWYGSLKQEYDVNNAFFNDLHYYYPELANKIEAAVTRKYTQQYIRLIQKGIEEGGFRKDIIPEVVLESIYVQYEATARSDRFKRFRLSPDAIVFNTIATTIRGICTVKGAEALEEHIQTQQLSVKDIKVTKKRVNHSYK
jgi:AcrR family transcriptional regulator